jgi:hypothetical protein
MLDEGRKPEAGGELTNAFASYKQALRYFLVTANIEWSETDFPHLNQQFLFDDD